MLSIVFNLKKEKITEVDFVSITEDERDVEKYFIQLFGGLNHSRLIKHSRKEISMRILFSDKFDRLIILNKAYLLIDSIVHENHKSTKIKCSISFSDDYYPFSQDLLDHIYRYWSDGRDSIIDRSNFLPYDSDLYLDTSLLWSGIPESLDFKSSYFLDGKMIRNKFDLFIHLGEIFVGNKGYFGLNLDALSECLSMTMNNLDNKILFKIKNKDSLIRILGDDYFCQLMEVLTPYFLIESS